MSKGTTTVQNGGIGFVGALALLFIGLKLAGVIQWSWWLVLLPLWGGFMLALVIGIVALLAAFAMVGYADLVDRRERKKRRNK